MTEAEAISRWRIVSRADLIQALVSAGVDRAAVMADAILAYLPEAEMPLEATASSPGAPNAPSQVSGEGPAGPEGRTFALIASDSIHELMDITRQVFIEGGTVQDVIERLHEAARVTP